MAIIKRPINEMSDASAKALYNLFEEKGLSTLIEYVPAETYNGVIDFEKNYYYSFTQNSDLLFTAINIVKPFTIFQITLNSNSNYSIGFSSDFLIYRNDVDANTDCIYNIWFCSLPGGSVATSIVKVGTYESPVQVSEIPYAASLVNRYNYSNVVVDDISQKISEITSLQNANFSLFSNTDSKRPILNSAKKRIEFNNTAITENKEQTLFIDSNVWSVIFLTEFDGDFNGSVKVGLLSDLYSKFLFPYTNTTTGYINNVLMSIPLSEDLARGVIGVHAHALVQTASALEYYIDGTLIKTQPTTGVGLTLTNILSSYSSVGAQPTKLKYFYDAMFYDTALDSTKLSEVMTYLGSVYPNAKPSDGPVISNFALTNVSDGQSLSLGDTINFSYTVDSGTVAEVFVYFMTGPTHRVVVKGNTVNSVLIPSGLINTSGISCKILAVDSEGRCSNFSDLSSITFTKI